MSVDGTMPAAAGRQVVGYVVSRFPKLTETFILSEMLAVEELGVRVELFPLMRARATASPPEGQRLSRKVLERIIPSSGQVPVHPEAVGFVRRAHYGRFVSRAIVRDNWRVFRRDPRRYARTLGRLLVETWGSWNYLIGGVAIFPLAAHMGERMRTLGVHHVHAHFANHPATAAWIINQLAGIPYSFTAHGADLQVDQHMLRRKVRDAKVTVTISEYNRRFIADHVGTDLEHRITVIRCGVDTNLVRPAERPRQRQGAIQLLCIGTFYEVKGHPYLIEACRILAHRGAPFVLHLVGEGPDETAIRRQVASAGLGEQVRFEGTRTRREIVSMLHASHALIVPSIPTDSGRREGIPVVLMEAMAAGVPVVASGISGIPELVEHERSGLLVAPRDPVAIADAIERLRTDAELSRRLAEGGRRRVTEEFDQATNASRLLDLLGVA